MLEGCVRGWPITFFYHPCQVTRGLFEKIIFLHTTTGNLKCFFVILTSFLCICSTTSNFAVHTWNNWNNFQIFEDLFNVILLQMSSLYYIIFPSLSRFVFSYFTLSISFFILEIKNSRCGGILIQNRNQNHLLCAIVILIFFKYKKKLGSG